MPFTKVVIEGRPAIDIPPEIAGDDKMVIASLMPIYPQAAEAELRREQLPGGDVIIHVTPIGKAKGATSTDEVARRLSQAHRHRNQTVVLAQELALHPPAEDELFNRFEEIHAALNNSEAEITFIEGVARNLDEADGGAPLACVPVGL